MASLNTVLLMGNLTRDPEVRYTPGGSPVCTLGVAMNRRYTARNGEQRDEVTFVDVDVWDKSAENCQRYLHKGDPVFIEGRLRMDEWDDRETGKRRSRLKVTATRVQFLSGPGRGASFEDGGDEQAGGPPRSEAPPRAESQAPRPARQAPPGGGPAPARRPPPAAEAPPPFPQEEGRRAAPAAGNSAPGSKHDAFAAAD